MEFVEDFKKSNEVFGGYFFFLGRVLGRVGCCRFLNVFFEGVRV